MYSLTEILISLTSTKENFPTSKIGDGKSKIQEYLIFMTLKSTNCLQYFLKVARMFVFMKANIMIGTMEKEKNTDLLTFLMNTN